jgi:integrase
MSSSTLSLWAVPSPPDTSQKKPVKSARIPATSVLNGLVPQDFVASEHTAKPLKYNQLQFGAFRSFEERADTARNAIMESATDLSILPFEQAVEKWLKQREAYVSTGTIHCYRDYIARLNKFFGPMILGDVHIGHIQEYQRIYRKDYHPASVNHDINTLSQVLRRAGLWAPIAEHYRTLPTPRQPKPRVLTHAQEDAFFEFAASDTTWFLAYWEASLSNNTTAYGVELRLMQRSDVDLTCDPPTITVPLDVKNDHRPRVIPLNERGKKMIERIMARATKLGSTRPENYLFPFRIKRNLFDPTRPASPSWTNGQWNKLVKAALEKKIIPFRISRRNFRNQPITKMLEAGVPIETVRVIAGHVSDEMTRYYDQHRTSVKAAALDLIDPDRKKPKSDFPQRKREGVTA